MMNRLLKSKQTRHTLFLSVRSRNTPCFMSNKYQYYALILALILNSKLLVGPVNCNITITEDTNDSSEQQYDSLNNNPNTTIGMGDSHTELTDNINDLNATLNNTNHDTIKPQVTNITDSEETVMNQEMDAPLNGDSPEEFPSEEIETHSSMITDDDYTYDVSFIPPTEIEMNDIESYTDNDDDHHIQSPQPKLSSNIIGSDDEISTNIEDEEHENNGTAIDDDYSDNGNDHSIENATVTMTSEKDGNYTTIHNTPMIAADDFDPDEQDEEETEEVDQEITSNQPISEPESKESKQRHPEPPSEVSMPTSLNTTNCENVSLEKENADKIDIDSSANLPDNHNLTQQSTSNVIDDNTMNNKNIQAYHCSSIWGDMNVTRRGRPQTNLTILQQLFNGEIILSYNLDSIDKTRYQNITKKRIIDDDNGDNNLNNVQSPNEDKPPKNNRSQERQQQSTKPTFDDEDEDDSDIFLSDIDESNELFEDVDLPDEFDVGTNNASIQEVIMGSATRVVIQRFTIVGRYIFRKARATQKLLFRHAKRAISNTKLFQKLSEHFEEWNVWTWLPSQIEFHEIKLLQWMYNDDGEYAPFQSLRNNNGEWIIFQKLKNDDGDLLGISQIQIQDTTEWVQRHFMNIITNVNKLFDKIFTGPEMDDEEMDFKFLSDENFAKQKFDPPI